jgi:hypothetical protein
VLHLARYHAIQSVSGGLDSPSRRLGCLRCVGLTLIPSGASQTRFISRHAVWDVSGALYSS